MQLPHRLLTIPNSVTEIGSSAFSGCSGFSKLVFNATNCGDFTSFSSSNPFVGFGGAELVIGNGVQHIPSYFLNGCTNFTGSLTIGNSVAEIGIQAFMGCSGFNKLVFNATNCDDFKLEYNFYSYPFSKNFTATEVVIGDNVQRIPANFLYGCTNFMGSLTIPESVATIGSSAFKNCSGFTAVRIPGTVTIIGNSAFGECTGLTKFISYGTTPASAEPYAFNNVPTDCPLYVPTGTSQTYQGASEWSGFSTIIERNLAVPEDVNSDNTVDINDVNEMLNCILERQSDNRDFADINSDDKVNVIDLNEVIEYILNH